MQKILMISSLNIWSMGDQKGAPSLFNTIDALKDAFYIEYLSQGESRLDYQMENVSFHFHNKCLFKQIQNIRKIGGLARILDYIYMNIIYFYKGRRLLKREKIDLIYAYEVGGTLAAKTLSICYKIPLVTRFQGTILKKDLPKFKLWTSYFPHTYALSAKSDLIIMTNDGTQGDQVLAFLKNRTEKICFWMNGVTKTLKRVNPENVKKIKTQLDLENKNVLMTVSRLVNWKRLDRIIVAMPNIIKHTPNTVLLIVGDGAEREKLEELVKDKQLGDSVFFLGSLNHEQVLEILDIADIFVSLYDLSNVGNPLLEAMIAQKPIITLNNGDTGKFIQNEENGILLELDAISDVPSKITYLFENKDKAKELGENAGKFAQERFWTWEERMTSEVNMLKEIIGE